MNYSISFTEDAQEELREVALYIQTFNPAKAAPFVNSIIDYFSETLGEFPNSGKLYFKDIRKLTFNKHHFLPSERSIKQVEVIHVVDSTKLLEARKIEL